MFFQYTQLNSSLSYIDLILWISGILLTWFYTIYAIIKYSHKREMEKYQKQNIITWIIFLVCIGIANILNIIWRFGITNFIIAKFIEFISQVILYSGILIKIINIEQGINRSNFYRGYYFSIIDIISVAYGIIIYPIITGVGVLQIIYIILTIAGFLVFPGIFIYMAIKTTGTARKRALLVVFGAFSIGIGLFLQPQNIANYIEGIPNSEQFIVMITIICPILVLLGVTLIFISFRNTI